MLAFVDRNALSYAVSSMSRVLVIAVALLAACADKQLEQLQAIKAEVCACEDPACGEAAMKKVPPGEKIKSTAKKQRVAKEMMECMAKLLEQGRPTTDPDAAVP